MRKIISEVRLKKGEERRLAAGHLWVYSNEIDTKITPLKSFTAGDLVQIVGNTGKVLGVGYVNPRTLLCVRLLFRNQQDNLDEEFFVKTIEQALQVRQRYFAAPYYRLVFAESDYLPGLIVDRFGEFLVAQITTAGMEKLRDVILSALVKVLQPKGVLWRNDGVMRELEGLDKYVIEAYGTVPPKVELVEHGVRFTIDVWRGQKTGWFYDQSYNRERLRSYVQNGHSKVLDVFCYCGAWGIQAAAFGAEEVTLLDSSEFALGEVKSHAKLNGISSKIKLINDDAFAALKNLYEQKENYDLVIIDPPAFIKRHKDLETGKRAYLRLHELALSVLNSGGLLFTTSCSMHMERDMLLDILRQAGLRKNRKVWILEQLHQAQDHPLHPAIPETNYLKGFVARVE